MRYLRILPINFLRRTWLTNRSKILRVKSFTAHCELVPIIIYIYKLRGVENILKKEQTELCFRNSFIVRNYIQKLVSLEHAPATQLSQVAVLLGFAMKQSNITCFTAFIEVSLIEWKRAQSMLFWLLNIARIIFPYMTSWTLYKLIYEFIIIIFIWMEFWIEIAKIWIHVKTKPISTCWTISVSDILSIEKQAEEQCNNSYTFFIKTFDHRYS